MSKVFKVNIIAPSASFSSASIGSGSLSNVNYNSGSISGYVVGPSSVYKYVSAASGYDGFGNVDTDIFGNSFFSAALNSTGSGAPLLMSQGVIYSKYYSILGGFQFYNPGWYTAKNTSSAYMISQNDKGGYVQDGYGTNIFLYSGSGILNHESAPFRVDYSGNLFTKSASITSASISGGTISNALHSSGSISGTITNLGLISGGSANFVTASINGVAITTGGSGGSSSLTIANQGTILTTSAKYINFAGAGVTSTNSSGSVTVTIAGGGSSSPTYIAASAGTVGGWNISSSALTTGTTTGTFSGLISDNTTMPPFFAGAADANGTTPNFYVTSTGTLNSTATNITGGFVSASVNITGGDSSGFHFNSTTIDARPTGAASALIGYAGLYSAPASNADVFIWSGSANASKSAAPFRVDYAGNLWAKNAIFTSASVGASAIATQNYITSLGYAQLSSANFTAASVASNPIYTKSTAPYQPQTFSYTGSVAVYTSSSRFYNDTGGIRSITSVRASVGSAPTGSAMLIDVRKNGTSASNTIFTGSSISIPATSFTSGASTSFNSGSSLASGDYLTVAISQVGSTAAGSDLTVQVNWS